jgi:very-short-patch-repair endonuclease
MLGMSSDEFGWLLERQAGVFTRRQALDCGVSATAATAALQDGGWVRVAGRGFVLRGQVVGVEQGAWAAVLTVPRAVVCGPSAFALRQPAAPLPRLGSVTVALPSVHLQPAYRLAVRQVVIPAEDWSAWRGLPVQKAGPALVDSLAGHDEPAADALFAWALARAVVGADELGRLVGARRGRPGRRRLGKYLALAGAGAASALEAAFQLVLVRRRIGGWTPNAQVKLVDGSVVRVDVLFKAARLAIELDGRLAHSSRHSFQADRARQNLLVAAGYKVLRFTWEDVVDRPDHCAKQILQFLTA